MEALAIITIVGLFLSAATVFGTDSRDGDDWIIHRSV